MTDYYGFYKDPAVYSTATGIGDGYAVVASGPAALLGFSAYNGSTGTIYAQVHNTAAQPASNVLPQAIVPIPATSANSFEVGSLAHWHYCPTGLTIAASTSAMKYVAVATGCMFLTVYYNKRS